MKYDQLLKRPIITEKTIRDAAQNNIYAFETDKKANKDQIKLAIEKQFNVSVISVKIQNKTGKMKRAGGARRIKTKQPNYKKALFKLKEKDKIDLFEIG